jgi:hypothetical protein
VRKVRHLESCEYISPIGQKTGQLISLSSKYQSTVEKTTRNGLNQNVVLKLHAQFDSDLMNGIRVIAFMSNDKKISSCVISSISLFRVSTNWVETFVTSVVPVESNGVFTAYIDQSMLGSNELSGAETYLIDCTATRRNKTFRKKVYFNHLGIFDSVFRLKQEVEFLDLTKVDE